MLSERDAKSIAAQPLLKEEVSTGPRRALYLPCDFLVFAAFFAEADLSAAVRLAAAPLDCFDSAALDAGLLLSRFKALVAAAERFAEGLRSAGVFASSRLACFRVLSLAFPFAGAFSLTPARRALDNPMAIACLVFRTPCSPARTRSISSRTKSPACVEGELPEWGSASAFLTDFLAGILSRIARHPLSGRTFTSPELFFESGSRRY